MNGGDKLFAARIPSAYAARWQYQNSSIDGISISGSGFAGESYIENFVYIGTGASASVESGGDQAGDGLRVRLSPSVPLVTGNGMRLRLNAQFSPSPLSSGNIQIFAIDGGTGSVVQTYTPINQDGSVDVSFVASYDGVFTFEFVMGDTDVPGTPWTIGETAELSIILEYFPPTIPEVVYSLNPAIPFHKIVLAIPDESFGCVATINFENGGTIQGSSIEIALGPISGRFLCSPPSREIQCNFFNGTSATAFSVKGQRVINNEDDTVLSTYCAAFEWSAVADKVRVSFSNFVGNPSSLFSGILQLPPS